MKSRQEFSSNEDYKQYIHTYFAAMAMQAILSTLSGQSNLTIQGAESIAKESVLAADKLLEKLES
jgi:hypothetical protein